MVADAAIANGCWTQIAVSDADPKAWGQALLPKLTIVDVKSWQGLNFLVHISIGDNAARAREAEALGIHRLASICHPAAVISTFSSLAEGCFVAAGAVVAAGAKIERGVIVNHAAVVDHDVHIGNFSHIAPHATLGGSVKIGRRVLIGAGAVVLPSITIGDDVVVGAGAVVTGDLTAPGVYVGVPARKRL